MKSGVAVLGGFAVMMLVGAAQADDSAPDAGAPSFGPDFIAQVCAKGSDHARAMTIEGNAIAFMKVASSMIFQGKLTLNDAKTASGAVRADSEMLKCNEPALSPNELVDAQSLEVRAAKWADAEDAKLAAEEKARAEVVLPLCQAVWGRDNAQATIEHEKANPSGVVDLKVLHDSGEAVQYFRAQIAALTPMYVSARRHGFTTWQSEGACVAEANKPEGQ